MLVGSDTGNPNMRTARRHVEYTVPVTHVAAYRQYRVFVGESGRVFQVSGEWTCPTYSARTPLRPYQRSRALLIACLSSTTRTRQCATEKRRTVDQVEVSTIRHDTTKTWQLFKYVRLVVTQLRMYA